MHFAQCRRLMRLSNALNAIKKILKGCCQLFLRMAKKVHHPLLPALLHAGAGAVREDPAHLVDIKDKWILKTRT